MTPERLQELEHLFHDALERDPADRARYLDETCGSDRELRQSVEALLEAEPSSGRLRELIGSTAALASPVTLIGRRVGAYQIEREIGQGGMGAVYLAIRADDAYHKQVAIKVVSAGWTSEHIHQRFQSERQILANLEHPYIARLLDGGATFDGRPYIVMEYVDGAPITGWAESNQLDTAARIRLFRRICEAVQYAHQHLVVHRDLKPANILIAADGIPKLLDFGIAKLVDVEAAAEATQMHGWRPLTPNYASPEQFRGERITTAADIYSLGAILYVLLAGQPPYQLEQKTLAEAERIVCSEQPLRPSLRNPRLRGRLARDLDTIALKCLRKAPAERYASVGDLISDLDRALAARPLHARNYSLAERACRFLLRHRTIVMAASLLIVSLIIGTVVSMREAARASRAALDASQAQARAERNGREAEARRQEAVRERARAESSLAMAERVLNDEHRLTVDVLLGLSDSLSSVPGATAVRSHAISASAEYLDRLTRDSASNPSVQQDLATAYMRLAEITGHPENSNQGDLAGSLALYSKAEAIVRNLLAAKPNDPELRRQLGSISCERVGVLCYIGRGHEAQEESSRAIAIFQKILADSPQSPDALTNLGACYVRILTASRDFPDRRSVLRLAPLARGVFERLVARNPQALEPRMQLADAISQEASARLFFGDTKGALEDALQTQRIREQLRAEFPANYTVLSNLMYIYGRLGDIVAADATSEAGYQQQLDYYQKARDVAAVLARDTADQKAQLNLAISLERVSDALGDLGRHAESVEAGLQSNEILRRLSAADPHNTVSLLYIMVNLNRVGYHEWRQGHREAALQAYRETERISRTRMPAEDPQGSYATVFMKAKMGLALDAAERGDRIAVQWAAEGLRASEESALKDSVHYRGTAMLAVALALTGEIHETLAQHVADPADRAALQRAAAAFYRRATASWEQMPPEARGRWTHGTDRVAIAVARSALDRLP